MIPRLTALTGPLAGTSVSLTEDMLKVGRLPENQLVLPDPLVSRQHCQFTQVAGQVHLHDLGSNNGTYVNRTPVKERVLQHGDTIKLGESVFLFIAETEVVTGRGEAVASERGVSFEEQQLAAQQTLTLAFTESRYLDVEQLLAGSTVTARLAREFQALLQIALELNQLHKVAALQRRLLELISGVIPAERGAILLLDEGQGEFISAFGWERGEPSNQNVQVSRTLVQQVVRNGVAVLYKDVPQQLEFQTAQSLLYAGVQSILAAPLALGGRVFGVIYLDACRVNASSDNKPAFDEAHLQLVTALANLSAAPLAQAREREHWEAERQARQAAATGAYLLIGESAAMQQVEEFIAKVAPARGAVLLRGESGTGKEIVAHALHLRSPRHKGPFQAINCAVLTDSLLESELFGHEKGAFTGAIAQKKGKLELANGGTLFLDEIGELAPALQAKLLRVLQDGRFERLGATQTLTLDVRVVAATNRNLEEAIQQGSFRADLYYRLKVLTHTLAPLRERREDIWLLANHFRNKFAEAAGKPIKGISVVARQCLQAYDWPGNVRELQNALERAVTWCSTDFILPEDLPTEVAEAEARSTLPVPVSSSAPEPAAEPLLLDPALNYRAAVKQARQQIILNAFAQSGGDHQQAAKLLGLHPNNLHRELRRLNLRELLKIK